MEREKATEYRHNAEDCIAFAEGTSDPEQKLILLLVAKAWLVLARFIETSDLVAADMLAPDNPPTRH